MPLEFKQPFNAAVMAGRDTLAGKFRAICLIGLTGHGKSMTGNSLCGQPVFSVSAFSESETDKFSGVVSRWRKKPNLAPYIYLDTPGIGDS